MAIFSPNRLGRGCARAGGIGFLREDQIAGFLDRRPRGRTRTNFPFSSSSTPTESLTLRSSANNLLRRGRAVCAKARWGVNLDWPSDSLSLFDNRSPSRGAVFFLFRLSVGPPEEEKRKHSLPLRPKCQPHRWMISHSPLRSGGCFSTQPHPAFPRNCRTP